MPNEQIRFSIGNPGPGSGMSVPKAAMLAEKLDSLVKTPRPPGAMGG